MAMVGKVTDPLQRLAAHIPRSQKQLETETINILKLAFWAALLAPVILVPAYYLLVALGLAPPTQLP
jgi:hypothetical protein